MDYRELGNTGMRVSILSYGASPLGGVFGDIDADEGIRCVHTALDHGVNFIDVSPFYGDTLAETILGRALRDIRRDRYYLATKVGRYGKTFDYSAERVTRSIDESLTRLGVEYVDLIQAHDIEFAPTRQIVDETLPALHAAKRAGKVRHIGITAFPLQTFRNVLQCVDDGTVETVLSFSRYTLNDSSLEQLLPELVAHGVGIINASPTNMGLLTPGEVPPWHPAGSVIRHGCHKAVDYCRQHGIDIIELAIQFAVAHPQIATTLVGAVKPQYMASNIRAAEKPIDRTVLAEVLAVLAPIHNMSFSRGLPENRDELPEQH